MECPKCKAEMKTDVDWDYFEVKGYRIKNSKCECGHEWFLAEPFSKEKKNFWETIKGRILP